MPGPEWMKAKYPKEKWSTAYTANVTIGQGYVLASPLQLAMAYATVANGGVCYTPRLVKTVLDARWAAGPRRKRRRRRARPAERSAATCARK